MSLVLVSAYLCLTAGTASQRVIEARADAGQTARVALGLIVADLRAAVPLSGDSEFIGMRRLIGTADGDNVDFATRNYNPRKAGESDWCKVSYYARKNPRSGELSLFRRRDPTPDPEPLSGGDREEIASGILGLRFEYFDGWDWYDEWGDPTGKQKMSTLPDPNVSGLPEAVRITLSVRAEGRRERNDEAELDEGTSVVLQTVARLNMATFFYNNSGGGSSGDASGDAADSGGPAVQPGGSP